MSNSPQQYSQSKRTKVFLSWHGAKSRAYGQAFLRFFERFGAGSEVFFSPADVQPGQDWRHQVYRQLHQTKAIVSFITKDECESARWLECESAAVYLADEETLVFPVLIDLTRAEIPTSSAWGWKGPLSEIQVVKVDFVEVSKMLTSIANACGIHWDTAKGGDRFTAIHGLLAELEEIEKLCENVQGAQPISVLDCFQTDDEFAEFAYQYHRIIHGARDVVTSVLQHYNHLDDPDNALTEMWEKHPKLEPLPAMLLFETKIKEMLEIVQYVFGLLFKGSSAKVWICLRDLRGDGAYHNFLRSSGFPAQGRISVPWPSGHLSMERLRRTAAQQDDEDETGNLDNTSGKNCTILTDPTRACWPPSMPGRRDPHRKQSILGAVLLKKVAVERDEPHQGMMWWVLCANSDTPGVFGLAHRRLLQGCNDAFSAVANAILRASNARG